MVRKLTSYLDIDGYPCGHQLWWGKESYGHHFGCGVIGGIDGLIHQRVVGQAIINKKEYMALADGLWTDMRPNTGLFFKKPRMAYNGRRGIGVYSLTRFKKGVLKFADRLGYSLNFEQLTTLEGKPWYDRRDNFELALAMIERSLKKNQPIHLLSWRDKGNPYEFHWLTIVGVEVKVAKVEVTIMTWGTELKIEDFKLFWHKKGLINRKALLTYSVAPKS